MTILPGSYHAALREAVAHRREWTPPVPLWMVTTGPLSPVSIRFLAGNRPAVGPGEEVCLFLVLSGKRLEELAAALEAGYPAFDALSVEVLGQEGEATD